MSFFSTNSCLQYSIRTTGNSSGNQILKLRLGHCSRLISGFPHQILQQTPSTLMGEALFPLCLREREEEMRFLAHFRVVEFLCSFNFRSSVGDVIFEKIASVAAGGFSVEADIDYVMMFWMEGEGIGEEEIPMVEEGGRGAPEWAIERLMEQKFDGIGIGIGKEDSCSVCYDELESGNGEEMTKMPCGHVYHKPCILTWLQRSNSCPNCRSKLQ